MKLQDVVALIDDVPVKALQQGQVGTIVEVLAPSVFEVVFCDLEGRAYGLLCQKADSWSYGMNRPRRLPERSS